MRFPLALIVGHITREKRQCLICGAENGDELQTRFCVSSEWEYGSEDRLRIWGFFLLLGC